MQREYNFWFKNFVLWVALCSLHNFSTIAKQVFYAT